MLLVVLPALRSTTAVHCTEEVELSCLSYCSYSAVTASTADNNIILRLYCYATAAVLLLLPGYSYHCHYDYDNRDLFYV